MEKNLKFALDRIDQLYEDTADLYLEYINFKSETDLTEIEVWGFKIPISKLEYPEWLEWRFTEEARIEISQEDLTIEADYEEVN